MGLTVTSKTAIPATVYERVKANLLLSDDDRADTVLMYLDMAVDEAEIYTGRALWNKVYKYTICDFPSAHEIVLPRSPVSAVASVKYYDADGTLQTLSTDDYSVNINDQNRATLYLDEDADWPDTDEDNPEAVEIAFTAGYGTAMTDIPASMLGGIIVYAGHLFDNRHAGAIEELQPVRDRIFRAHRATWY